MKLVPIPTTNDALLKMAPLWVPFLDKIARRSKETVNALLYKVANRQVQPILIWDEAEQKAVALLGISYHMRGNDKIAEWVWLTGVGRKSWEPLLSDLEQYLMEYEECAELRPICRPGWSHLLKKHGYRITHYMMEKTLKREGVEHGQQRQIRTNAHPVADTNPRPMGTVTTVSHPGHERGGEPVQHRGERRL